MEGTFPNIPAMLVQYNCEAHILLVCVSLLVVIKLGGGSIGAEKYFLPAGKFGQISNFGWNDHRNSITIKRFDKISVQKLEFYRIFCKIQ